MGKIPYGIYALIVISVMGTVAFSPSNSQPGSANSNSYYHGGTWGDGSYSGSSGSGHK